MKREIVQRKGKKDKIVIADNKSPKKADETFELQRIYCPPVLYNSDM